MANWDEETLNNVINQKHGEAEKSKPKTAIVRIGTRNVPVYLVCFVCMKQTCFSIMGQNGLQSSNSQFH